MGAVYRAQDTKLNREVAVKVLPETFAQDSDRLARFTREAQVLASLNHPNIAAIYGVEERALVMELVEGATLDQRIAGGAIPLDAALPLITQLIEALEYAHERGVVHRDLKPANIKVTPDGRLKVLDFGLAKALTSDSAPKNDPVASPTLTMRATMAGTIMGTAAYMSPEQARGQSVDKRADIWAFGVLVYEMMTGHQMFAGPTISDTLAAVLTREPDWNRVPPRALPLVRACLERDPKRRLRDIGDATRLLEQALSAPTAAPPPSRSLAWIAATAVFAIIAAAAGWIALHPRPVDRQVQRYNVYLGASAVSGLRITAVFSPDGKRIVYPIQNSAGVVQLATRTLEQSQATPLPGTDEGADPFFSPDGQWVGFFSGGRMKRVSVHGGAPQEICNAASARGASWGEDGKIVLSPGLTTGLARVPESGGTPEMFTDPTKTQDVSHRWPQILPGGKTVLYTRSKFAGSYEEAAIAVRPLKNGEEKIVASGGYFGRYVASGHLLYVHQGTLYAQAFDPVRLETRGGPVPVQDEVAANPISGGGQFDVSSLGTLAYLPGKGQTQSGISWVTGKETTPIMPLADRLYLSPRVSPDGSRIAFSASGIGSGNGELWVQDLARSMPQQLTFNTRVARSPVWSHDGKHIALTAIGAQGGYDIVWIRADGAGEPVLLLSGGGKTLYPLSFTPDGKRLGYTVSGGAGGVDIYMLPLDLTDPEHPKAGAPEPFLTSPATESSPMFSPDGRWIAYTSDETGATEVYVRQYRAGAPASGGRWRISVGGARYPIWSHDGRHLFYLASDSRLTETDCTATSDTIACSNTRRWSDRQWTDPIQGPLPNVDLAPDDRRFLVVEYGGAGTGQPGAVRVTFLLNFLDELRRRAP